MSTIPSSDARTTWSFYIPWPSAKVSGLEKSGGEHRSAITDSWSIVDLLTADKHDTRHAQTHRRHPTLTCSPDDYLSSFNDYEWDEPSLYYFQIRFLID